MPEFLTENLALPHPNEVKDVWGRLDEATLLEFSIEQIPGFETHFVPYRPNQRLAIEVAGPATGRTMIFFHGMPGSRLGPKPDAQYLWEKGVQLISYDRPGYGFSDPEAIGGPYNAPEQVRAILDYLSIDYTNQKVDLIGRSGGFPYALGCAALWPEVVNSVAALASLAPRCDFGLEWYDGMCESNIKIFSALLDQPGFNHEAMKRAWEDRQFVKERLETLTEATKTRATAIFDDEHQEHGPKGEDEPYKLPSGQSLQAGLRPGVCAWLKDIMNMNDWGFDPDLIRSYNDKTDRKINAAVWQMENDVFAPRKHTEYLVKCIGAEAIKVANATHFAAIRVMQDAIEWCLEKARS